MRDVGGLSAIGVRPYHKKRKSKQAENEKRKKSVGSIDKGAAIKAVLIMLASLAVLAVGVTLIFQLTGPLLTILKTLSRFILNI